MNKVFLIGRLTKDVTCKYGADTQTAYAKFSIALDRGKDKNGNDLGAYFPNCVAYGKTAENLERFTKKGRLIAIEGEIVTGKYENKKGEAVFTTDISCKRIEFLEWGDKTEKPKEETQMNFATIDDDIPF